MSGKGSARRPQQVSDEQLASSWEQIFGRKEEETKEDTKDENQNYADFEKAKESK